MCDQEIIPQGTGCCFGFVMLCLALWLRHFTKECLADDDGLASYIYTRGCSPAWVQTLQPASHYNYASGRRYFSVESVHFLPTHKQHDSTEFVASSRPRKSPRPFLASIFQVIMAHSALHRYMGDFSWPLDEPDWRWMLISN